MINNLKMIKNTSIFLFLAFTLFFVNTVRCKLETLYYKLDFYDVNNVLQSNYTLNVTNMPEVFRNLTTLIPINRTT